MGKISYKLQGDYFIPDLIIDEEQPSYGKYGNMRKAYLKNHKPVLYRSLLLSGRLNEHLTAIDTLARFHLNDLMERYLKDNPAPDKATQQMEWVGYMNNVRHSMEEIVLDEFVYCN